MKFCTNCGKELDKDAKFCKNCGNSVKGESTDTKNDTMKQSNESIQSLPITNKNLISVNRTAAKAEHTVAEIAPKTQDILAEEETEDNILNILKGTNGIEKIQKKSKTAFERYDRLAKAYNKGKDVTIKLIADFVFVRNDIETIYRKYLSMLSDIFGNGIKSAGLDIFNFNSIEYLDVMSMFNNFNSQYEEVKSLCNESIYALEESLSDRVDVVASAMDEGIGYGLLSLAGNVVGHIMDSSERTSQAKEQYEKLQDTIRHDVDNIEADSYRLAAIIKNINDLFIPQANAFYRSSEDIFSSELHQLIDSVYSTPKLREMKKQRDTTLMKYKSGKDFLTQKKIELNKAEEKVQELEIECQNKQPDYVYAISKKPSKFLNIFFVVLTAIGIAIGLKFDGTTRVMSFIASGIFIIIDLTRLKKHTNWVKNFKGYIDDFYDLCSRQDYFNQKYIEAEEDFKNTEVAQYELQKQLEEMDFKMMQSIQADATVKKTVGAHLESLVKLLRTARNIIESQLDDEMLKPVDFPAPNQMLISQSEQNAINKIISTIDNFEEKSHKKNKQQNNITEAKRICGELSDEETIEQQAENDAWLQTQMKITESVKNFIALQMERKNRALNAEEYERRLVEAKKDFKEQFKEVDKKAEALNATLKKLNTSLEQDETLEALAELSSIGENKITKEQMESFLNGTAVIEI